MKEGEVKKDSSMQVVKGNPDRVKFSISLFVKPIEAWVSYGLSSDVGDDETLDDAKERITSFVEKSVEFKVNELIEENS